VARAGRDLGIDTAGLSPLDFYVSDLEDAEVRREWKRIDLLIVANGLRLVVAVELKLGSSQVNDQLQRYRKIIAAEKQWAKWRRLHVFLTIADEAPLDAAWIPLRYEALVPALERTNVTSGDPTARAVLTSYLAMLRRHHVTDERLEELAQRLWSKHGAALAYLAERRPKRGLRAVFELLNEQRVQTAAKIGSSDVTLQADVSSNSIVRFVVPAWDSLPGFLKASGWGSIKRIMVFELKLEGEYANGYLYLGPAPAEVRQPYLDILNAHRYKPDQAAGTKWTCIAKQEIYGPASDNIDVDAAAQEVVAALREFCRSEVNRITPLLKQVVVPPPAVQSS
jgi:hypothetical protein